MRWVLNRNLAVVVLVTFLSYVLPTRGLEARTLSAGKQTADEAASWQQDAPAPGTQSIPLRFGVSLDHSVADTDTTEFEFPKDRETHLARDIAIFVIVAAFVGYFIIKVFLEGDTDQGEEPNNGKDLPPI
jgi:hypothetical protein